MFCANNYISDSSGSEEEEIRPHKKIRRMLVLSSIPKGKRFKELFRLNTSQFEMLLNLIEGETVGRCDKISMKEKLMVTLNFYATGAYQRILGEGFVHPMSQSTASKLIEEITSKLERTICPLWIKFPKTVEEKNSIKETYFLKTGFFGVIGCIDCTHVRILCPVENEHVFVDRFGNHSMNVQLVCDYNLRILSVVSRFPGSTHDAAIWEVSKDKAAMQQMWASDKNSWLLGDSGYPLQPWLLTPYRSCSTPQAEQYNSIHSRARNTIERCNGTLKARFRCLSDDNKLRYHPKKVSKIINVCCALHNLCLEDPNNGSEEQHENNSENPSDEVDDSEFNSTNVLMEGQRIRNNVANQLNARTN